MAPTRLFLALAVAAILPMAGMCRKTSMLMLLPSENPQVFGNVSKAQANYEAEDQIFFKPAEAAFIFGEPTVREGQRAYIILAGAFLLLAEAALVLLLVQQMRRCKRSDQTVRRLTRRLIHAGEEERRHLARELHDDIGQRLSLVSVELGSLSWNCAADRRSGDAELEHALEELRTLISDVHGLSHRLHSSKLEHLGLQHALKELCHQIAQRHDLGIDLQMDQVWVDPDRDIALCLYRVAQEALNNVVRHSSSARATVRLVASWGMLRLQVSDDGAGFDPAKTPVGLGLVTMEERLRIVGGRLLVASKPGNGTSVTAQVSLAVLNGPKSGEARKRAKALTR